MVGAPPSSGRESSHRAFWARIVADLRRSAPRSRFATLRRLLTRILHGTGVVDGLHVHHDVQKCTVYLVDLAGLAAMDAAYSTAFDAPYPARTTVGVAALPGAARVQIELVARRGASR